VVELAGALGADMVMVTDVTDGAAEEAADDAADAAADNAADDGVEDAAKDVAANVAVGSMVMKAFGAVRRLLVISQMR